MANENENEDLNLDAYSTENRQLIQAVLDHGEGECKNASAAGTKMIRRRIRENGFSRKILPPRQVSDADLNRLPDTELPAMIEDMEADQPGAKSISFNDTPDTQFYRGENPETTVNLLKISALPSFLRGVYAKMINIER